MKQLILTAALGIIIVACKATSAPAIAPQHPEAAEPVRDVKKPDKLTAQCPDVTLRAYINLMPGPDRGSKPRKARVTLMTEGGHGWAYSQKWTTQDDGKTLTLKLFRSGFVKPPARPLRPRGTPPENPFTRITIAAPWPETQRVKVECGGNIIAETPVGRAY